MTLTERQRAILSLWYVVNASLTSYTRLIEHFGKPELAITASANDWKMLGIHKNHTSRLEDEPSIRAFLRACEKDLADNRYRLVFVEDMGYPSIFYELYDPPPVLFYQGNLELLNAPQLAIVGTRNPSDYAKKMSFDVAQYLVQCGYVITSGLAEGVDAFAHKGALAQNDPVFFGKTVGVMGTGIDVCYPKTHRPLFDEIVAQGGCLISELLPGTQASKHTFPRRNRLVAGLSLATIITEATLQSGSLITARLTAEQGKQVFALPNRIDEPNSEGCHHLIREGATLFYHPKQIMDEVKNQSAHLLTTFGRGVSVFDDKIEQKIVPSPQTSNKNPLPSPDVSPDVSQGTLPPHLTQLYGVLDKDGQDLDALIDKMNIGVGDMLAQLVELEILGLVSQMGGRYAKT